MKRRLIFALIDLIELRDYYYTQTSESRQSYFLFLIATNLLKPCLPATRLPFPLIIFRLWCLAAARGEQRRVERERESTITIPAVEITCCCLQLIFYIYQNLCKYLYDLQISTTTDGQMFCNLYLLITTNI